MPFLFERIGDETELLLPDNLLNTDSLIRKLVAAIDEDDWKEVEIIGWLYQFYISEKKDEVFAGLKKNQKVTPENIPAATQIFTPHWIVRYLVENSLGRLWLLNHPDSRLAEKMPYYIAPVEPETDFIHISLPEEIKVCDPACGSGHMLTYAFDLLCEIYQEAGYAADEIAPKILANNLVGIEIDDRAGALAAFALAMKAAEKLGAKRLLRLAVKPDICVLQNVTIHPGRNAGGGRYCRARALHRGIAGDSRPVRAGQEFRVTDRAEAERSCRGGASGAPEGFWRRPAFERGAGAHVGCAADG